MDLPPLQAVDWTSDAPLPSYLRALVPVCPFIEPAAAVGCLYAGEVAPDCRVAADVHARVYEQLVPQIERFRDARRLQTDVRRQLLLCHTVVLRLPSHLDTDAVRLLGWPNLLGWALKQLYTPKAIVLGFVRKGVAERTTGPVPVPVAPFHAVIIRSRVATADGRFYPGNPALLNAMLAAEDDGRDVHSPVLGPVPDVRDPQALRADGTYQRVLQWLQTTAVRR